MRKTHTLTLTAVLLIGSLLGACGSADDTQGSGDTSTAADSFEDYQLAFAKCMREHGIDLPDPSGGSMQVPAIKDMDAFTEASKACQKKLGPPPAAADGQAPESDEEQLAKQVKIAECFREHGIDVPDPKSGETLTIPLDAPSDVMETCAPDGISGPAGPGGK